MTRTFTRVSAVVALAVNALLASAQLPCNGTIGATSAVTVWAPAVGLPANTTITLNLTTTAGSNLVTIAACNAALITNLAGVTGPNVAAGTFISGGVCGANTVQLNQNATVTGTAPHVFTMPAYAGPAPPASAGIPSGLNCSVCPGLFSASICANQYVSYYMCAGNVYTISLCGSAALWNSTLSITTAAFASAAGQGFALSDDDGCGTVNGHATLTFAPSTSNTFRIRVFNNSPTMNGSTSNASTTMTVTSTTGIFAGSPVSGPGIPAGATVASITNATTLVLSVAATSTNTNQPYSFPCIINAALCGTINITCAPAPPPPTNDNPCGATPLTVGANCNYISTGTSWATSTNPPGAPACGSYAGYDVWYSAVVPATGALAIQTNQIGASNLAMAVYTATACNAPLAGWTAQYCNADIAPGVLQPYIAFNSPGLAGQTVYIRVWPQSGAAFGGSFEICAYQPNPPVNDNPCAAVNVPVTAGCTTVSSTTQDATPTAGV
ncbi:MAG TPA: hypothetical protein PK760_10725, partial [Flavobacteriales bacterium]|nr:hypothetical protein [Flavobacteriales bacterium]